MKYIVVLLLGVTLVGCSSSRSQLLGKWEGFWPNTSLEFRADGKLIWRDGLFVEGTYTVEPGRLVIFNVETNKDKDILNLNRTQQFSISGNVLTMTQGDGSVIKYRRVSQ